MNAIKESYHILKTVILHHGYCNVLIAQMMQKPDFSEDEKILIQELVNETLKHQIYLNYLLSAIFTNLNIKTTVTLEFKIFLWLMLYQLYFHGPENLNDFFEQTISFGTTINQQWKLLLTKITKFCRNNPKSEFKLNKQKSLAIKLIKYSYPEWLYFLLKEQFSSEIANALMKDNLKIPVISFRVNTLKTSVAEVLADQEYQTFNFQLSKLVSDGIISAKTIFMTELYRSGKIIKQDQASILVSHILNPQPTDLVWDMCAGIGSKTAHLAALMRNQSTIYATDIDSERLALAKNYLNRLGVTNTKFLSIDATKWDHSFQFDKILIDAPSTAFGLIKRKPELKLITWTKEEMHDLVVIQSALLDAAYHSLKIDGIMLYVTCTFNTYENQMQIENFMKKYPNMIIIEERQILGVHEATDGFYICKLKKQGGW